MSDHVSLFILHMTDQSFNKLCFFSRKPESELHEKCYIYGHVCV